MKYVLVSYNNDPTWVKEYTDDWVIFDRSEKPFDFPNTTPTENIGQVDFDKLTYLIDNYHSLPDVFLWGKTNLFKSITKEEFDEVKDNTTFTPLLTKNHDSVVDRLGLCSYYSGGIYHERSNLLYMSNWKYFESYPQFAHAFQIPCEYYVPFAPGGNYILTKEVVHRYSRDFYLNLRSLLPYTDNPVEAHWCERAYYTIWK